MSPLKSKSRGMCKWLPICSQFVSVMRSRPSFPMDEIINSWGQTAWFYSTWREIFTAQAEHGCINCSVIHFD